MSNNKEIICKLIKAKNQEANSYTDQTCYNAAYCYGYVDGATMALNTLSGVPERHKCYAILSHYSNLSRPRKRLMKCLRSIRKMGATMTPFRTLSTIAKSLTTFLCTLQASGSRTNLNTITTFTLYLNRMQRCRKQNAGGALVFKVLGGIGRSVPLYNGKARILVKAIIPVASSYLADMQSVCEANGWKSVLDERGNLVVLSVVSIDAYRLSDSTLMTAYLHFAETAAQKLTGCKNRYLVAGVVSYDAAA